MEDNRIIELPNLTVKTLESMLLNSAEIFQKSYQDEVNKMTEILDPNSTIKDVETCRIEKERLIKKWQLQTQFKSFDERVLKVILRNCDATPLLCQQYFVNLLQD